MARGTALSTIVTMVKAELMVDTDAAISPGGDAILYVQCSNMQKWLALKWRWPFLMIEPMIAMVAGTRYYDFPAIELGRPIEVDCYFGTLWNRVDVGIDPRLYNSLNPVLGQKSDPVSRYQVHNTGSAVKLEVWPLPATATSLRLRGQKVLATLATGTDTAELDDLLIAQFTAAKLASRMKSADAPALLSQANDTLKMLRAGYPSEPVTFNLNAPQQARYRDLGDRPTVAVTIAPS